MNPIRIASRDHRRGSAVVGALALLLILVAALGGNYIRNYQIDQAAAKQKHSYANYKTADLEALAEGYRMEVRRAEKLQQQSGRVKTRQLYHFDDQVKEFERVQKAAERSRERSLDAAQVRADLEAVEAELKRRASQPEGWKLHLVRLTRI